jgi:predicted metalloprotease
MRWQRGHTSPDVIDRRGQGGGMGGGGNFALISLAMMLIRRFGIVGVLIVVLGMGALWFFGGGGQETQRLADERAEQSGQPASEDVQFVSFVLDDVQNTWTEKFGERNQPYQRAKLVLFTDRTSTGCGYGNAATGPFYCPLDRRAYIDLGFFRELDQRFGASGDFAQAYVLAHEIGHHVQNLLGTSDRVHRAPASAQRGAEGLSVRLELQADCYAGVWAQSTARRDLLEIGDIDEALRAAAAIGDDRLQRQSSGTVSPDSFTHGSSDQRARWFRRGAEHGTFEACDTFSANVL